MELYRDTSYQLAEQLTTRYSTSFSMSSKLFAKAIRPHIYAIYGMVRLADEIVDTYKQPDANDRLMAFKQEVIAAVESGYSTNPLIHAFCLTARQFSITKELIDPFFASMAMDLSQQDFTDELYTRYIHGSAEVVGLMCLRVFVSGNNLAYSELREGAQALGAAYQKVNFLRDIKADHEELDRLYFPSLTYAAFNDTVKDTIVADIRNDFAKANQVIAKLPVSSKKAVRASSLYYQALLDRLDAAKVEELKTHRVRAPNSKKLLLLIKAAFTS